MNDRRKNCSSTLEENRDQSDIVRITQSKSKINRLKRSPKTNQTQKSDITNFRAEKDFKTPTRVPKLGFRSRVTEESPNDSELQHEIIWDPTSPATPVRNGRGRRRTAAFKSVDISDIVNRIAPKNKRSEEAESTLLQWIGDTAIPCTPEIREPRTKPKPARPNLVDDLLKLAKKFDFNMIQQEEAHLQPDPQSSAEAMREDQDLFFDEDAPAASPQTRSEAEWPPLGLEDTKMNSGDPPDDLGLVQKVEDDLDLLFEGSTQQLTGGLSQGYRTHSQDMATFTPQFSMKSDSEKKVCGVTRMGGASESSAFSVCVASKTLSTIKQVGVADDFDDDWNNDYLLDDSLVMEMTQNPELFSAPQCSSTQKQTNKNLYHQTGDTEAKSGEVQRFSQRLNKVTGNEKVGQSGFNSKNTLEPRVFPAILPGSRIESKIISQPKKPVENQQQLATPTANSMWCSSLVSRSDSPRSVPSVTTGTAPTFRVNKVTKEKENHPTVEDDALCDLAAEDLDSIFASDDIWDDGADDDDLFCEACEKVEESMAEPEPPPKASISKPTPQSRGTLYTTSTRENGLITLHNTSAPDNSTMTSSERIYRFSRVKTFRGTGRVTHNVARQVSESTTATADQSYQRTQDVQQFKNPCSTFNAALAVSKDVSKAVVTRCSDAEIEKKKQQAMERRRRRLLASQNVRAPV